MDKKEIENQLNRIIAAANSMAVQGEHNAAQVVGICAAARKVFKLIQAEETEAAENGG